MKQFYLQTFGCQMNEADSDQMRSGLHQIGWQESENANNADLILINTCSVREKPEVRVNTFAHQYALLRKQNPNVLIGITGCVAQQEKETLIQTLPFIDFVLGPDNIDELAWCLEELQQDPSRKIVRTEFDSEPRVWRTSTQILNPGPSAFISIMKGCDHFCSYCIVPTTRGREKSRPIDDIVRDVQALVGRGVHEVTFLGQNINSYGKRAGESLHQLFYRVHDIEGLRRIRFTTSHPGDLKDELIQCFRDLPKLCSQFHLPVQSGSDRVLRTMRRFYSIDQYRELVFKLRDARPDIALTSDIIVGFPGEDESDFEKTLSLVKEIQYENVFSFLYSARPGTAAATREDTTPTSIKIERLKLIQAAVRESSIAVHSSFVGHTQEIMIEGPSKKTPERVTGRNSQGVPVHVDARPGLTTGDFINVMITEAKANYVLARENVAADVSNETPHHLAPSFSQVLEQTTDPTRGASPCR